MMQAAEVGGGIGGVSIDGKIWNQISLRPEFSVGPVGVGLDVVLFIDGDGNIRKDDWDFRQHSAQVLLDKILYVRYGRPGDHYYLRAGALDDVTLGFGILVNHYSNMLEYPAERHLGIQGSVQAWNWHLDAFVADLKSPGLTGARLNFTWLAGTKIGITVASDLNQLRGLKDRDGDGYPDELDKFPDNRAYVLDSDGDGLADSDWQREMDRDGDGVFDQINNPAALNDFWDQVETAGASVDSLTRQSIPDRNVMLDPLPLNIKTAAADPFTAVAFDASWPMPLTFLNLTLYTQIAKFIGQGQADAGVKTGWGATPVGMALSKGWFGLRLEYRKFGDYFTASYFDHSYDLNRVRIFRDGETVIIKTRDEFYLDNAAVQGVYGDARASVLNLVDLNADYQWMSSRHDTLNSFNASVSLREGLVPKLSSARAYYIQNNEINPFAFHRSEDTMWGYNVDLALSEGVILRWKYQQTYRDLNGDGMIGKNESVTLTGVETLFSF